VVAGVGLAGSVGGVIATLRANRRADDARDRRAVMDRFLTATIAGSRAFTRYDGAVSAQDVVATEHAIETALNSEIELRSAALAMATRYPEGDVLTAQAWASSDAFSDALAHARQAAGAGVDAAIHGVMYEDANRVFIHYFNQFVKTARMIIERSEPPAPAPFGDVE
jgi:hypothetical protein